MKTKIEKIKNENKDVIVAFHIGRGGRFNNQGHLSVIGEMEIGDFTNDLYPEYENLIDLINGNIIYKKNESEIRDLVTDGNFEDLDKFFSIKKEQLGDLSYNDEAGNPTGLTQDEVDSGIGRIDIDGYYDTTYTTKIGDLTEMELEAIKNADPGFRGLVIDELSEFLNSEIEIEY